MKVNLIALGGQGDVRPYMAVGSRLQQMGHTVKIATHGEFEGHVRCGAEAVRPLLDDRARDITKACLGTEAVIFSPLAYLAGHIAERMGIPCLAGDGVPEYRTRYYPSPFVMAGRSLGWPINWL